MLVLAMAAALTGCTVGSEYLRPDLPAPESFAGAQAGALGATCEVVLAPAVDLQFWRGLRDPMLSQLIDAALESSHDLRVALKDTENALVRLAKARVEDRHLESAALDSATAARLPRLRFEAGAVNLHDVLDAERTRLVVQDAFADARTRSATAAVALYRALAGGYGT